MNDKKQLYEMLARLDLLDECEDEDSYDSDYKPPVSKKKTIKEKQQAISDLIEENPEKTDYWISKELGVSHNTVAAQRKRMAAKTQDRD